MSAALVAGAFWIDYRDYLSSPLSLPDEAPLTFEIKAGSSLKRVVDNLAEQAVIEKPRYILLNARLTGKGTQIHTGEYRLEPGMTVQDFLDLLYQGKVIQYSLTLIEGWNFKQMMAAIHTTPQLEQKTLGLSDAAIMQAIGHGDEHPEGRFMPDTYRFTRGMSDVAILKQAYNAMADYLEEQWPQRAVGLPYETAYEALIMASIVEKETGVPEERDTIAGVFVNRLEKRMRLQTDPTVIYGMGDDYDGNIRRRDLRNDTPYNTYTRGGLPPTPIAMPGREAIHAALHPDETEYLYFVSRGDGSHYFSKTLKEHNQAVIQYQLKGRKRSFSSYKNNEDDNQ
ncbi:endolytic transglycosylase MltG [Thiohalophilus sp.]|uniref:endolytic transglycosylase MltG n=1 Tax=Thiohalophilus sp. TaxID=3028392 RepID=UPI002ACD394C|nr:endolytic transglycosylase MltG [Thiohalophilus sp.]MDZ7804989.1 endolytic transglycosylase MltG [Thiohalophilus sp.]